MEFLFDDHVIDRQAGVRRVLGMPRKESEPVFAFERPWEVHGTLNKHSLLYDAEEQRFKLWYRSTIPEDGQPPTDPTWGFQPANKRGLQRRLLCYAESGDGLTWQRPSLGLVEFAGSRDNNILVDATTRIDGVFHNIVKDPDDPDPNRRYKSLGHDSSVESALPGVEPGTVGICVSYSPDGLRWEYRPRLVFTAPGLSDAHRVLARRDPESGKWIGLFRPPYGRMRRFVGLSESDDFESWTPPRVILGPDSRDDPWLEFYGMSVTRIDRWRVGCLWVYRNNPEYSPLSTELVYSRDGLTYHRAMPGVDFLPLGTAGEWDSGMHELLEMIEQGPEFLLFYNGANLDHGANHRGQTMLGHRVTGNEQPFSALGAARLPWGQFCGLRADYYGVVETTWMSNHGDGGIRAFAAMEPDGWLTAEIIDEWGEVIPGWDKDACRARSCEDGRITFSWGRNDLIGIPGQVSEAGGTVSPIVKVRFHLRQTTLFGFQVGSDEATKR